ncbi:MAG: UDP-N-acetylmuramate--L-alanine ligase, partial [Magnetococcales bacterium]|nr:UDP-N-acetylmuramate--L-alanine ligase [Magnetococcales bacterium]
VATILGHAKLDPTVVNGGIVKAFGSNARMGQGDFLVTEADESDGSFLKLNPTIAVVTNIDPEHMEHYGTFDKVREAFQHFVEKSPFYGLVVLCQDHDETCALADRLTDKRVITYGFDDASDLQVTGLSHHGPQSRFTVVDNGYHGTEGPKTLGEVTIAMPGRHNVLNTLAAIAIARELEVPWETIVQALGQFGGVQRRFDLLLQRPDRVVIDDYAHHPTEIRACLEAVRASYPGAGRLVAVFQPHRYSRVMDHRRDFQACFSDADLVMVDRIHPAGETPTAEFAKDGGVDMFLDGIPFHSHTKALPLDDGSGNWMTNLEKQLQPGDVVVFLGAGTISRMAHDFAAGSKGNNCGVAA